MYISSPSKGRCDLDELQWEDSLLNEMHYLFKNSMLLSSHAVIEGEVDTGRGGEGGDG